jgi:uncharacterized protein (DUF302 family)
MYSEDLGHWKPKAEFLILSSQRPHPRRISKELPMLRRIILVPAALVALLAAVVSFSALTGAGNDGIIRVKSAYPITEAVARIKQDVADKGIMFFSEVDQSKLAAGAGLTLRPSILLTFGNPPLGTQFITSNPNAGLDWPVRLLVFENDKGEVWTAYTDFAWIAQRHVIKDRDAQFKMASSVVTSILSSVTK